MTKEQIVEKLEKDTIKAEDVYAYYEVRNIDGLEIALEQKLKVVKVNDEYINGSFKFIFEAKEKEEYNPIQEKYYFFSTMLPALYGTSSEEVSILIRGIGLFQTMMLLDKILAGKPEVEYYKHLYNMYQEKQFSLALTIQSGLEGLLKLLEERTKNLNMEDLKELGKNVLGELDKFTK